MKVYRLQNALNQGPFNPELAQISNDRMRFITEFAEQVGWVDVFLNEKGKPYLKANPGHPHHIEDVPVSPITQIFGLEIDDGHEWRVGTKSMEQLLYWFPPKSHAWFAKEGFELAVWECECDHIRFGQYQVMFCIDHAIVVERHPLNG
jgi:hypothetical protein